MGGDDLYHFPTPTEAFGVKSKAFRKPPSTSSQTGSPNPRYDLPPLHPQQPVNHHPRTVGPPQQQRQFSQGSAGAVPSPLRQQQHPQQQQFTKASNLGRGDRSASTYSQQRVPSQQELPQQQQQPLASGFNSPVPSFVSDYSGYSPSRQADPTQLLERQLRDIFDRVDRNRDGKLNESELALALLNNDGTQFRPSSIKLMVTLFDKDGTGTIEFKEFYHLWNYILHWRKSFNRYDVDQNQKISFGEYQSALESFGYRLPTDIVLFVFQKFGEFHTNQPMSLRFDMFVESLIWLLRCTNVFKRFDREGNGVATIPFQDFVHEILALI